MTNAEKLTLKKHACHIRMGVIEGTHSAKCGHPGGSLDIAEVLSYLYFVDMNVDPENPKAPDRDRLVLSKGHAAPGLYAALAERAKTISPATCASSRCTVRMHSVPSCARSSSGAPPGSSVDRTPDGFTATTIRLS